MAKSGIYAFGVTYQTKVVYVYQDKIGHVEKGKISIWIRLSIFRVAEVDLTLMCEILPSSISGRWIALDDSKQE